MKKIIPLIAGTLLLINLPLLSNAQIITTIAGNGTAAYIGDGGPATASELNHPTGVISDTSGNIYIGDANNNVVRKINAAGIISTIAGTGTAGYSGDGGLATAAQLNSPSQLFLDASGNLYIAEFHNNVIRKINTAGIISTVAGNGTAGYSGDGGAATAATLNTPGGVITDISGNIYITDDYNYVVRKVNTAGIISTIAGNGTAGYSGDGGPATSAQFNLPDGLCSDLSGNIYIVDGNNSRIRKINAAGIITTFAGTGVTGFTGDGGPATAAELYNPYGVIIDTSGNIYIADQNNNSIRMVNSAGVITTLAGNDIAGYSGDGGAATSAELNIPSGVCLDNSGNIYIADQHNQRIRKVTIGNTGIAGVLQSALVSIFPNPAHDNITIQLPAGINNGNIQLLDELGQLVSEKSITGNTVNFNLSNLPDAIYILKISANGWVMYRKLIKN